MIILNLDFLDLGSGYKKFCLYVWIWFTDIARKSLVRNRSVLTVVVINRTFRTVSFVIGWIDLDFDWIDLARKGALEVF